MTRAAPQPDRSATPHVARLNVRDRIVALGHGIRSARGQDLIAQSTMLIELAAQQDDADPLDQRASGPIELLAKIPTRWRDRHADEALHTLARSWTYIPQETRPLALALGRDRWLKVSRILAQDSDINSRLAVLHLARDTADPGMGKIVCRLLRDEEQRVRQLADETVLRISLHHLRDLPEELLGEHYAKIAQIPVISFPVDPQVVHLERSVLLTAVGDAAWNFATHRCRSPLVAALLLMEHRWDTRTEHEVCARMRRLLTERKHPSHAPLRSVLKRTDCPLLRDRALRWLQIEAMSNASLERLRFAESPIEHTLILDLAPLAMRPRRASKLCAMSSPRTRTGTEGLIPEPSAWNALSEQSKLGLLRFDALLNDSDQVRRQRTEPALADQSEHVRLNAAAMCASIDLQDYLFDTDESISRHAALRWSTLGVTPPKPDSPACVARVRLSHQNTRSPHASVRQIALAERARLCADDPHDPVSRHRARSMYATDPSAFIRHMRDRLAISERSVDAITMIRLLEIERRFELDLIGIVQNEHSTERARANAVTALAKVDSNAARYIVSEAIASKDDRVRANAIELAPIPADTLVEFRDDQNHRVRANAIKRLIEEDSINDPTFANTVTGSLIEILGDPRPMHRLAGAWVAQHVVTLDQRDRLGTRWGPVIAQLEELAATDENPNLRIRASRCIQRLRDEIQSASTSQQAG